MVRGRRGGDPSVAELSKDKRDKRETDEFFLGCIEKISKTIANKKLTAAATKVAKAIGPIQQRQQEV